LLFFLLLMGAVRLSAQVGLSLPKPVGPTVELLDPAKDQTFSFGIPLSRAPVAFPTAFKHAVQIDSANAWVLLQYRLGGFDLFPPRRLMLADYLRLRYQAEVNRDWREYAALRISASQDETRSGRGLTISSPKIKSEAFRRVFGGDNLSLTVTGNITINGEMRNEKRSQMKTAVDRAPNTNFQMKQTQNFKVTGKIGENVSVDVDQDSERMFEFENNIKLKYSSEEDGIIQSIEAGNVALSLPATNFVTFSAQNSGLFGIKTQMKIGGLDITAIASMEKGEKKKLSLSGGKEDNVQQIFDYDYKRNTYFFFSEDYRERFKVFEPKTGLHEYDPNGIITEIEVYKSDANYMNQMGSFRAWAIPNPALEDTSVSDQMHYKGYFLRLEPLKDYYINKELGYIAMNMSLQEDEVLAVAYRDSSKNTYGTLLSQIADTSAAKIYLKLIKPKKPRPADPTWNLEWKNVYQLGSRDLEKDGFELKLYRKTPSGDPEQALTQEGKTPVGYLKVFGLDEMDKNGNSKPDDILDDNPNLISWSRGELIFPDLKPFDPENILWKDRLPAELRTGALYDTLDAAYIRQQSKFYLEVKSSSRSANYSLGMNVIEGSEKVTLNGADLIRDKDYILEPMSGSLTLLHPDARNPNAKIEITYESQQMISIDKKSLLGLRAEYRFRENATTPSFIGGTLLYMNQKTMDQRIRLGQPGPMRNIVWDVNTAFGFQPNLLTKAVDALPVLQATAPSSLKFEGEIAQVIPNPNTLNNEATGDKDGVAYLDDFEGSKREISLGVIRTGWGPCSPPNTDQTVQIQMESMGHLIWYNPYSQVPIQEIWPKREVTTNYGGSTLTHVLKMMFVPRPGLNAVQSWGGIQRYLSAGYADQTNSRFVEIMVKGNHGTLHVDLGQVSEDVIPNGVLDSEDQVRAGIRNDILDEDEDRGLDGVYGNDSEDPFASNDPTARIDRTDPDRPTASPYDWWDVQKDGIKQDWEPWSFDNWHYQSGIADYSRINGTENSKNDGSLIYPNTEDLNDNGDVDLNNDFFRYSINLDKDPANPDTKYIVGNQDNVSGWRLYQIPLNTPASVVGQPQWSRIEYARIWIDGVTQPADTVTIADIALVGNEWKFQGVSFSDSARYEMTQDSILKVDVMNTHDNPEYTPPSGVEGVVDPIQKIRSKEQALRLTLNALPDGATAVAQKQFYESEDLIHYRTLKMFVHGGNWKNEFAPQGTVEFFLRWGSDTENKNYYEVRFPVYPGWDLRNQIELEFEELSNLKVQLQMKQYTNPSANSDSLTLKNGHRAIIVGKPSLTNVRWLVVGVRYKANATSGNLFSGELWIDELRLSNVRKDKGMAMRAKVDFQLSDLFTLNGQYNRKDADFHTVNERFGEGSNSEGKSLNASLQLHRFFPSSWGISIPVSTTYNNNLSIPKYIPGTDILLNASNPLLNEYQNKSEQKGFNVSISRSGKSRNFLMRALVDPVSGSFNYSRSDMSNSMTKYSRSITSNGSFRYRLSPSGQNYVLPFSWVGKKGLLKKMSQVKLTYLPTSVNFDLTANKSNSNSESRISGSEKGIERSDTTASLTKSFDIGFQPFQILTLDYSKSMSSDMRFVPDWGVVFTDLNPGIPTSNDQTFGIGLNPKIVSWFNPSTKYNANYKWSDNFQMKNQGTGTSSSISTTLSLNGTFDPAKFLQMFSRKKSTKNQAPRKPVIQAPPKQEKDAQSDVDPAKKKTEKNAAGSSFTLFTALSKAGGLFKKIDPITVSVTNTRSSNDFGILGTPDMRYQFGLSMDPNVEFSPNLTSNRSNQREDYRISFRSGLKITSNLTASFDYNFSDSQSRSTQKTGTLTKSVFIANDKGIPFPNWNVQWRGLEKIKPISKFIKSLSLSHTFSGQEVVTWNDQESRIASTQLAKNFRPLLGVAMTFKNNITGNVQYTSSVSLTLKKEKAYGIGKTKQISNNVNVSGSYARRGGIRIPFLKNKKLDNNIDFKLTFEKSLNVTYQSNRLDVDFAKDNKTTETKNWSLEPRVDYTFSSTVQGGVYLKVGQREDLRMGKTKVSAFGINCNISLAGR
jgi:cell surface protein SprA